MEVKLDDVYIAKGFFKYMLEEVSPDCGSVACKFRHKNKQVQNPLKHEFCTCFMPENSRENHLQCAKFASMMKDFAEEFVNK